MADTSKGEEDVIVGSDQILYDRIIPIPTIDPPILPWHHRPPGTLYKYFPPERLHVLTDCAVRFSQRQMFEDQHDLRPPVANYGTREEILAFMNRDVVFNRHPTAVKEAVADFVLKAPGKQQKLMQQVQKAMKAPEEFGVFCLCENPNSPYMWKHYAANGHGFVVEFNTRSPAFIGLQTPGLIGKVTYTDDPVTSFLGEYGAAAFFRKGKKYAFEQEWRSVRALHRFKNIKKSAGNSDIYLARFDPRCINRILISTKCSAEWELRTLAAVDTRYSHSKIVMIDQENFQGR